jgi:hypothetical protein
MQKLGHTQRLLRNRQRKVVYSAAELQHTTCAKKAMLSLKSMLQVLLKPLSGYGSDPSRKYTDCFYFYSISVHITRGN